jgi:hypothetical protein
VTALDPLAEAKETTMTETAEPIVEEVRVGGLVRRTARDVVLMPVMDVALAKRRLEELQEFCASYLSESKDGGQDGGDYGIIPGTGGKRKTLFKSGAEKLCDVFGLADRFVILTKVEDFDHGLFDYVIECRLVRKTDEMFVGSGLGSCSSYESKYRWREARRVCPACGKDTIIKGKQEYGGGYVCWKNKGGCGAKFADTDPAITDQKIGRVENPDIIDAKNTVLKIAKKRAKIDAVISVTRSSGIFTQDLQEHESDHEYVPEDVPGQSASAPAAQSPASAPAVGSAKQPGESQADYVARVKREAQQKSGAAAPLPSTPPPAAAPPAPQAAPVERPASAPPPPVNGSAEGMPSAQVFPPSPAPPVAAPAQALPAPVDGKVYITGINVRNGPMVVTDGVTKPVWGPLFVIAFSNKVKAGDGVMVADATTFDEALAKAAEDARDTKQPMAPVVVPGKKKGSYSLSRFA